jgi:hypothetical protein
MRRLDAFRAWVWRFLARTQESSAFLKKSAQKTFGIRSFWVSFSKK